MWLHLNKTTSASQLLEECGALTRPHWKLPSSDSLILLSPTFLKSYICPIVFTVCQAVSCRVCSVHTPGECVADLWEHFTAVKSPRCRCLDVCLRASDTASSQRTCGSAWWPHDGHYSTTLPWLHPPLRNALLLCRWCLLSTHSVIDFLCGILST